MPHSQSADVILRLAIQVEEEGALFYRKLARLAMNPAVKDVFSSLAEEEVRHQKDLAQIAAALPLEHQMVTTPINFIEMMKNSTDNLKRAVKGSEPLDTDSLNLAEALNVGIQNEKCAIRIYADLARLFPPALAGVLGKIVEEEKSHLDKLVRIKNFKLS